MTVGPDLPGDGEGPGGRSRRRRLAAGLVLGVLLAVGIGLLVGKAAGYETVLESLRRATPAWLAVCFAGEVVAYAGYIVALRGLAGFRGGPALSWRLSAEVVFGSLGATRLLAAGGAGGLAFDFWALRKAGETRDEAAVRVLGLNTLLYGVFGIVAVVAAALVAVAGSASPALTVPWLVVVPVFAALAVLVSSPGRRRALAERRGGRLRRALVDVVEGVVLVRGLVASGRTGWATVAGASLYWAGDMACLWAALRSFGVEATIPEILLAYATGYVATLVPLPTGGVGGVEAAMTFALVAVGVPLAPALLGVVVYRFFAYWLPIVPALAIVPALRGLERDLERTGR
jgi:uncharacterized membrane protein YbhN (UPF0104 family)